MRRIPVSPYLLLVLTTLFWSGNFVIGRAVRLEVPPIGLAFWRWALALAILLPFSWRLLARHWPVIRAHLPLLVVMGILGVTNFNTFVYLGLQTTTATNAVLLLSTTPVIIVGLSRLLHHEPVRPRQLLGIVLSLGGVLAIIARGDPQVLAGLSLAAGDLWVLAAVVSWALYSVLLQRRPAGLDPLAFLVFTIVAGVVTLAPFYLWESATGAVVRPSLVTLATVGYVAVFASILAFIFWNRAVAEVGPNRAGQFIHLIPVFGTLLSVVFLDERLHAYHLAGIVLIVAGIRLTTARR
ncbi:DMT family transporter [Thioalbus denitrificans]|uniref:Drug/metabolite transporter (DMT)-like permease n=1 Tax=Thioalbus denitrificans TaxID=547122 RepID=A0A369BXE4_9GAMM|nr:DMT family transporter [Thioalbus denitrificans]RCX26299.1 drug/metabolite transporter (DMT)-like permease [Thioalbus denitrificans]